MSQLVLREPLDRPRLLRIAIRGESAPADGPEVGQGVAAGIEGGVFVAGPPLGVFHTVEMWAGAERNAASVGCVPTRAGATVEIWGFLDTGTGSDPEPGTVEAARRGDLIRAAGRTRLPARNWWWTCCGRTDDGAHSAASLVPVRWRPRSGGSLVTGEPLPAFRYHPDPVGTGNVVARDDFVCPVCGQPRDYAYAGPYASPDLHFENGDELCPWCIADGSAAREWKASFTAPAYLSEAARQAMSPSALAELEFRTPSFRCLQQDRWLDHHGEADAYVGEVSADSYLGLPPEAQAVLRNTAGDDPATPLRDDDAVLRLRADGDGPAVYLFRCLHCGRYDAFYAAG